MKKSLASLVATLLLVAPSWAEDVATLPPGEVSPTVGHRSSVEAEAEGLLVKSLEVAGVTAFPNEQVRRLIRLVPGRRYQRAILEADFVQIRDLYENEEWDLKDIDFTFDPSTGKLSVYVLETVVEGITVLGTVKTTPQRTVLPNIRTHAGSVLNRLHLDQDLERLRRLGYFRTVHIEVRRGSEKGKVIVVFDVEEERTGLATIGLSHASGIVRGGIYGDASHESVPETGYRDVSTRPLSTFPLYVETTSYSNVRRFLREGTLPYAAYVRVEEFVNSFRYDYPQPTGNVPFSVTTELSECPWNPSYQLLRVGLQGRRTEAKELPPRNLVFLIDVSGSMEEPNKLPLLKQSLQFLMSTLGKQDTVAFVVYGGREELVLPATSCDQATLILEKIATLRGLGATNSSAGIQLAYETARKNFRKEAINRVILCTDGDFGVGLTGSALDKLIEEERNGGVSLTVLGFGIRDLNDETMESLADKGNGNYAYVDSLLDARRALVREAGSTLETIAKDVKLQIEFNPKQVYRYRLVGYDKRRLEDEVFDNDEKATVDLGAGHRVTALYELVPEVPLPKMSLRYQMQSSSAADSGELAMIKLRYKDPDAQTSQLLELPVKSKSVGFAQASEDHRFAASVASFGMLLRHSEFEGESDYFQVESWARGAMGRDPNGDRHEFLRLVELASTLSITSQSEDSDAVASSSPPVPTLARIRNEPSLFVAPETLGNKSRSW